MKALKIAMASAAALTLGVFAGACSSVSVVDDLGKEKISSSPSEKNVAHVFARNSGLYLCTIPLLTGNPEKPGSMLFGEDTVTPQSVVKMVVKKSEELGATKTLDLDTKHESSYIFPVFFIDKVQTSGNAVR
jgi:hypothetical protein